MRKQSKEEDQLQVTFMELEKENTSYNKSKNHDINALNFRKLIIVNTVENTDT